MGSCWPSVAMLSWSVVVRKLARNMKEVSSRSSRSTRRCRTVVSAIGLVGVLAWEGFEGRQCARSIGALFLCFSTFLAGLVVRVHSSALSLAPLSRASSVAASPASIVGLAGLGAGFLDGRRYGIEAFLDRIVHFDRRWGQGWEGPIGGAGRDGTRGRGGEWARTPPHGGLRPQLGEHGPPVTARGRASAGCRCHRGCPPDPGRRRLRRRRPWRSRTG